MHEEGERRMASSHNKLLRKMVMTLLPACVLPLLVFGIFALRSHYTNLDQSARKTHADISTLITTLLDQDVRRHLALLDLGARELEIGDNTKVALQNLRETSDDIARIFVLSKTLDVLAAEPPAATTPAERFTWIKAGSRDDKKPVIAFAETSQAPAIFVARSLSDGRYVVFEVALKGWVNVAKTTIDGHPSLYAALMPRDRPESFMRLSGEAPFEPTANDLARIKAGTSEMTIRGDETNVFMVTQQRVETLGIDLLLAEPMAVALEGPRGVLAIYGWLLVLSLAGAVSLIVYIASSIAQPIVELTEATLAVAEGRFEVRAPSQRSDEIGILGEAFNRMGDTLQSSQQRTRILYRAINDLFSLSDVDSVLKKAVEIACTQCRADAAWFVPHHFGREIPYAEEAVFIGLHGWLWKNHVGTTLVQDHVDDVWQRVEGDRVYSFIIRNQGADIGELKIAYHKTPDETLESIMHAMVGLVEATIAKQDTIRRSALVSTELEMAEAVQRNVLADNVATRSKHRVSFHYEPASRLGGDWFYLIENPDRDSVFVIIGDVTGQGLTQGLVTTAVKGALDAVKELIRSGRGIDIGGPAGLMALIASVVKRVAGANDLMMTSLVAEIDFTQRQMRLCNAGHTFPILVRRGDDANEVTHLHRNQQSFLGFGEEHSYEETAYLLSPDDVIVIYSDGLSSAKNVKRPIFGRILFRGLRERQQRIDAVKVRDDIVTMFRYYTQGRAIDDDVCFLVVHVDDESAAGRAGAA